tara:strand:+ start:641 stop:781 length:141 start_codon:yes stop_codon:yes gene_type:complete
MVFFKFLIIREIAKIQFTHDKNKKKYKKKRKKNRNRTNVEKNNKQY